MHVVGGYRTMSSVQICNGLGAYDSGLVKYRTLRSYFGCVAVLATREAASRLRGEQPRGKGHAVRPEEVSRLVGVSEKAAAADLRRLVTVGLLFAQFLQFLLDLHFGGLLERQKPAPLVQVIDDATNLERLQPLRDRTGAEGIGIHGKDRFPLSLVRREQSRFHQRRREDLLSPRPATNLPAHHPRHAALLEQRLV